MAYTTETKVYNACGMNSNIVQTMSQKSSNEVSTLITQYIAEADQLIKRKLGVPTKITKEEHIGDGRTNNIELGPWDDSIGMYDYDPSDVVQNVYAVYVNKKRVRLPYPKDCDELTESHSSFTASNGTLSTESTIVKCGDASVKCIFSAAGYMGLVLSQLKNIEPWDYIGFWFYSTSTSPTFVFRLYDKDGNYTAKTFTVPVANRWIFIRLYIDEFSGSVDWEDTDLYEFRIYTDLACTVYFDNFNFNDGWWWTYPEGLLNYGEISSDIGWVTEGLLIEVTYDFDPYGSTVPSDVDRASACLAGVKLLNYLIGLRNKDTGFEIESTDLTPKHDRPAMEYQRDRLMSEFNTIIMEIGQRAYTGYA